MLELLSDNRITEVHKEHLHVVNPLSVCQCKHLARKD